MTGISWLTHLVHYVLQNADISSPLTNSTTWAIKLSDVKCPVFVWITSHWVALIPLHVNYSNRKSKTRSPPAKYWLRCSHLWRTGYNCVTPSLVAPNKGWGEWQLNTANTSIVSRRAFGTAIQCRGGTRHSLRDTYWWISTPQWHLLSPDKYRHWFKAVLGG